MAIRIYSLAKDLGLDSKELVDLCARIGIQGKGSALASLEEDEIGRIKKHLEEKAAPAAAPAKEAPKPTRDVSKDAPIRDLGTKAVAPKRDISAMRSRVGGASTASSAGSSSTGSIEETEANESLTAVATSAHMVVSEPTSDVPLDGEAEVAIASTLVAEPAPFIESSTELTDEADKVSDEVVPPAGRVSEPSGREGFYSPADVSGKMRVIGRGKPADLSKPSGDAAKARRSRDPVININLAKIPKSAGPSPAPKVQEPTAMKPIVKLTPDVL